MLAQGDLVVLPDRDEDDREVVFGVLVDLRALVVVADVFDGQGMELESLFEQLIVGFLRRFDVEPETRLMRLVKAAHDVLGTHRGCLAGDGEQCAQLSAQSAGRRPRRIHSWHHCPDAATACPNDPALVTRLDVVVGRREVGAGEPGAGAPAAAGPAELLLLHPAARDIRLGAVAGPADVLARLPRTGRRVDGDAEPVWNSGRGPEHEPGLCKGGPELRRRDHLLARLRGPLRARDRGYCRRCPPLSMGAMGRPRGWNRALADMPWTCARDPDHRCRGEGAPGQAGLARRNAYGFLTAVAAAASPSAT